LRNDLGAELDERDYTKSPLSVAELKDLFRGHDPREFLKSKSPVLKAKGLEGKQLTVAQALKLMAENPNLIKRPLTLVGSEIIPGFDRDRLRQALA
jgi:arsenate reductase-like glutaredoxin family protein